MFYSHILKQRSFVPVRVLVTALIAPFALHSAPDPVVQPLAPASCLVDSDNVSGIPAAASAGHSDTRDDPSVATRVPENVDLGNVEAWKQLARVIRHDQKHVIEYPLHLVTQGRHWRPTLAVAAVAAGLIALDPHDTPYFHRATAFHKFDNIASGTTTEAAMFLVPAAFYAWSAHEHDTYGKQTVFLAAEAAIDVQILSLGMKVIDRRLRPMDVRPHGNYSDTWFDSGLFSGSFPSGHAITAFALADVFAERYREHKWVPWVSYALAGTVAFSRLPTQAHFPSDIFVGAVLGPVVTHYLVLHHRDPKPR